MDCLNRFLQELMGNRNPMGDKLIVLIGDFRQILTIVPNGFWHHIVSATIKNSELWDCVQIKHLRKNMRVEKIIREDPEWTNKLNKFAQWLLEIGKGTLTPIVQIIIQITDYMVYYSSRQVQNIV